MEESIIDYCSLKIISPCFVVDVNNIDVTLVVYYILVVILYTYLCKYSCVLSTFVLLYNKLPLTGQPFFVHTWLT